MQTMPVYLCIGAAFTRFLTKRYQDKLSRHKGLIRCLSSPVPRECSGLQGPWTCEFVRVTGEARAAFWGSRGGGANKFCEHRCCRSYGPCQFPTLGFVVERYALSGIPGAHPSPQADSAIPTPISALRSCRSYSNLLCCCAQQVPGDPAIRRGELLDHQGYG